MSNRTVIVDNNTWNNTHIATVGRAMSSSEYKVLVSTCASANGCGLACSNVCKGVCIEVCLCAHAKGCALKYACVRVQRGVH